MSAAVLKGELKAFEKDFKAQHGRAPTKDDIKARPDMALKYKQYNAARAQPAAPASAAPPNAVAGTSAAPEPAAAQPEHLTTPRKKPADIFKQPPHPAASLLISPSKARAAAISTRSPAGKAANPFATAAKDTPKTTARKYLSGQVNTPEGKRTLFSTWRNPQALDKQPPSAAAEGLTLPDHNLFRAPSAEPSASASAPAPSTSSSIFFDPTRAATKRTAPNHALFDAERKRRSLSPSAADNEGDQDAEPEPQSKRPKLSKRASATTGKKKAPKKAKGAAQTQTDVTMEEAEPEDDLPPARQLEDGSYMMSFLDAEGQVQEIRVRDYKPFRDDFDPDDPPHLQLPEQQQQHRQHSVETSSATASSMDVDAADVPAHLVELLSLNTSPNKKHRQQMARTKERLYKSVLKEPSLAARPAAGLLELAQEAEDRSSGWSTSLTGEEGDDEGSEDDDWQDESEGWKELGGMDLMGLEEDAAMF